MSFFCGSRAKNAGIYAFGTITSKSELRLDDSERIKEFAKKPSEFENEKYRVSLDYVTKLLENPILKKDILELDWLEEGTKQYNFFKSPQGVTSRDFDKSQFEKLKKMIKSSMDMKDFDNQKNTFDMNLNTILYGPPGTGKTYNTLLRAAEIVENRSITDYEEAKRVFNENLRDQIEFITFHQNYSYEDFIQGLRPDTETEEGTLSFKKKDGVFKRIADRALRDLNNADDHGNIKRPFDDVWKEFIKPLIDGKTIKNLIWGLLD